MMQVAHELDLAQLSIEEAEFAKDPMPYVEAARRRHPWLAKCGFGYVVHEYQAMKDLLSMDDKLTIATRTVVETMGATGTPWGRFMTEMMIAKTGEEHTRLRGSVAEAFTPRAVNGHRARMRSVVSRLLGEWAPKGAFDFAEFASWFPITVMCGVIGASPDVIPGLRKSLEMQGLSYSMDRTLLPAMEEAFEILWQFVDELILARKAANSGGSEDLLDALIAANTEGRLNDYELRNLLIFLFAAGYDTSKNMLTLIMHVMLQRPEQWKRCAEDLEYCSKVVEETLRYHSVSNLPRTVTQEFVYRDVLFPKDTFLFFMLTLAGRDPTAFPNPLVFDPERVHTNRHMAFGRGSHICLGMFLARAQIEEGVHLIAQRIANPRLAGEVTWRPFPGVWGIKSLPVAFDPALQRPDIGKPSTSTGGQAGGCPSSAAPGA
ncbi:MAG: cytochrome P450 [Rhizomicrobium sp.]